MVLNTKFPIPSVRDYIQSLRNIRKEWSSKTPLKKWCYIYGMGKMSGKMIGIPLYGEDQTLTWYSYMGYVYCGIHTVLAIYTIVYYLLKGELSNGLPCTCMLIGPVCSSLPLMFSALSKIRYGLHRLIDFGGTYIFPDKHEDDKYSEICSKQMDTCMRGFMLRFVIMFGVFGYAYGKMNYMTVFMGIKTTTTEVKIPFIGEKSNDEFVLNYILQTSLTVYGFFGYFCMEVGMELVALSIAISPKLIGYEFDKLDEKIEKKELTSLQICITFRNIIQQVMDIDGYKIKLADYLYGRTLIAPLTFTYSIATSIFCEYVMEYPVGYCLAILSYVQLYFLCGMAEYFADDGTCEVIYDTKWYALSIKHQKSVMLLIHCKQNGTGLSIGPFTKLNLQCFSVVSQKIYSFIMFLFKFLK